MSRFISRQNTMTWLNQLRENRRLVAPSRADDILLFQQIEKVEDIVLDYENTALSPKEWFFPKTETILRVNSRNGDLELVPEVVTQETVIFGIRPCDARGITILDLPYGAEPADTLYQQHREKTALVGFACLKACPECFCTSMGSGPDDTAGLDIMLTEVEGGYLVDIVTEKGRRLLSENLLSDTSQPKPQVAEPATVHSEGITKSLRASFDDPYWGRLADRCIHCNVCSYVCPTCYCFDIRDISNKNGVERVRSWESCQSPGFTKIAGGHDPRASKGSRMRQRFAHKLLYFPEQFGPLHCVGCGRCVRSCPVNIDIREIIEDVQKLGARK